MDEELSLLKLEKKTNLPMCMWFLNDGDVLKTQLMTKTIHFLSSLASESKEG